jgi:hypothetical protein
MAIGRNGWWANYFALRLPYSGDLRNLEASAARIAGMEEHTV